MAPPIPRLSSTRRRPRWRTADLRVVRHRTEQRQLHPSRGLELRIERVPREQESFDANGGHVTILDAGRATLEINDPPYAEYIDEVEVGTRVAGHIRVCFEVDDTRAATDDLV